MLTFTLKRSVLISTRNPEDEDQPEQGLGQAHGRMLMIMPATGALRIMLMMMDMVMVVMAMIVCSPLRGFAPAQKRSDLHSCLGFKLVLGAFNAGASVAQVAAAVVVDQA